MTREICGLSGIPDPDALCTLLLEREKRQAEKAYIAQTLWWVSAQLQSLCGGGDSAPDYFALFTPRPPDVSAESIREHVLSLLK